MWGGICSPYPPAAAHQVIFLCSPRVSRAATAGTKPAHVHHALLAFLGPRADCPQHLGYGKGDKLGVSFGCLDGFLGWVGYKEWLAAPCCHHYPITTYHPVIQSFGFPSRCFFPYLPTKAGPNPDRHLLSNHTPCPPAHSGLTPKYSDRDSRGLAREKQVIFSR